MPKPNQSAVLKQQLASILTSFPEVAAAYLFGSHARGKTKTTSDIDVALVPASRELRSRKLDILAALTDAGLDNVDLVILDTDDVVLRYEAIRSHGLLFARDDFDAGTYYSRVLREYLDLQPILRIQREAMKERLADG